MGTAQVHRTDRAGEIRDVQPMHAVADVQALDLCVTRGKLAADAADVRPAAPTPRIDVPTFRAVALGKSGDAASIKFVVHGSTAETRALSSGQDRRQIGLKLRAQDGCNLVYVMWRLDPTPKIDVSVKRNVGMATAKDCGAEGYTKVRPQATALLPALDDGTSHTLRAEIDGDLLTTWVDGAVVWQGTLPDVARDLEGPAGLRSDNLSFDLTSFAVDSRESLAAAKKLKCGGDTGD